MKAYPEKQLEYRQTLLSIVELIEKEKGCISCVTLHDLSNKNHFCLLAEWKNRHDLDNHINSTLFGVLRGSKSLLIEAIRIQIFTVSSSEILRDIYHLKIIKP